MTRVQFRCPPPSKQKFILHLKGVIDGTLIFTTISFHYQFSYYWSQK